jgi:hypothetical protein
VPFCTVHLAVLLGLALAHPWYAGQLFEVEEQIQRARQEALDALHPERPTT